MGNLELAPSLNEFKAGSRNGQRGYFLIPVYFILYLFVPQK